MKKLFFAIMAIIFGMSAEATTFEEFFATIKEFKGSNYTNIPKFLIPHNDGRIEKLELLELENLPDSLANKIIAEQSAITITKDVSMVQDKEDDEDVRIYMQTIGEELHILIVGVENEGTEGWSCMVTKMICDKEVLNDPDFIKFVKKDD